MKMMMDNGNNREGALMHVYREHGEIGDAAALRVAARETVGAWRWLVASGERVGLDDVARGFAYDYSLPHNKVSIAAAKIAAETEGQNADEERAEAEYVNSRPD